MDKLGKSLAVKVVLYLLMIGFIAITVLSGLVTVTNIANHWYYKDKENVKHDIYSYVSDVICYRMDQIVYYEDDNIDEPVIAEGELVEGEQNSAQMGYIIYKTDKSDKEAEPQILKEVNPQLKEAEGVFTDSMWHSEGVYIDVYLGDLENGGAPDEVNYLYNLFKAVYDNRVVAMAAAIIGAILSITLFIVLMCAAGRNREKRSFINKIPLDLLTVILAFPVFGMGLSFNSNISFFNYEELIAVICAVTVMISVIVTCYMLVFAVQVKAGEWWKNTVIFKLLSLIKRLLSVMFRTFGMVNMVWKTGLIVLAGIVINFMLMIMAFNSIYGFSGGVMLLWFAGAVITAALVIYISLCMKRLQEGARHLAQGDLGYKVDKKGLFLDLKTHAENLNDIGNGMAAAVEERLKSERFKTELITNVSHDIKTPITSIINYVDFLKKRTWKMKRRKNMSMYWTGSLRG